MKNPTEAELNRRQEYLDQICEVLNETYEPTHDFEAYLAINDNSHRVDLLGVHNEH